ncbi:hypothetical protein [Flavobacterium sp.]
MGKGQLLEQLKNTSVSNKESLELIGSIIRKEFDNPDITGYRAMELLQLAYNYQIPQLDEMLNDYMTTEFKIF